jgi:phosphate-selective porin OprO/OprP
MTYYGFPQFANIRVGHVKEPFSLEELTSDEWLEFTERSSANCFIAAGNNSDRNTGVLLFNDALDQHMTWAVGGFMQQLNQSGTSYQAYNDVKVSGRITYLPWYADNGCELVHLGFGYRHLFRPDNPATVASASQLAFQNTPEWHFAQLKTIDTGLIGTSGVNEINPELAIVYGPFSLQGEFFGTFLGDAYPLYSTTGRATRGLSRSDANLYGWYVMGSWFLTGEHRPYDKRFGVFGRPTPNCNFDPSAGAWGAWELAARYDAINLNDGNISGGSEQNYTGAIDWYLNPNLKWMLEYTHAHMNGVVAPSYNTTSAYWGIRNGDADIIDTRFQVDF